ncbi:MAG: hypothetical protein ACNA77_04515 [Opitutales bacterium]
MSLINQALRKAQRDRTPPRMADAGTTGPFSTTAARTDGMKPGLIIGLVIAVAVLLGLVAGLSVVLLKSSDASPTAQQASASPEMPPEQRNTSRPATESVATTPGALQPIAPAIESAVKTRPILERETTPRVVEDLRQAREAAEVRAEAETAAAAAEAKAADEAAARAAAEPNQEIITWLSQAQISGVKLSETESKVILNGKSYAEGELVNFALGLKVLIIQERRMLFVDDNGKKYMKRL